MKLLLDEMHAPSIAESLTQEGFDVLAVAAEADLRGMADDELLAIAADHGRFLVTENVTDFLQLVAQRAAAGSAHAGLILTNPRRFNRATVAYPGNVIAALKEFLTQLPVTGDSWTWWL